MDWTPGGMSSDVEDRRGQSGGGGGGFIGGGGGGIGIVGVLVLLVVSLVTGRNYLGAFLSGGGSAQPRVQQAVSPNANPGGSAAENRSAQLVSFVLDDAQNTWTQIFTSAGRQYRHAKLVLYRGGTYSGCGTARSQTGPFYCPVDEKIYVDLDFWDELRQLGGSSADFAQAYVIAHELGHHVQKLLGIEGRMQQLSQRASSDQKSALSVDLELQADCFAGVWGHSTAQRKIVDSSDVADALKAAAAVGDDHIARTQGRSVSPESFTHGTSAQREHWFTTGMTTGDLTSCTTFNGRLAP